MQRPLALATLNTRSLLQPGGTQLLANVLSDHGVDICALQQTGLYRAESTTTHILLPATNTPNRCLDAGFAISRKLLHLCHTLHISDRILGIHVGPLDLLVLSVYAPAASAFNSPAAIESFWADLTETVTDLRLQYRSIILLGDLNAHVSPAELATAGHPVHPSHPQGTTNDTGRLLLTLLTQQGMHVQNYRDRHPRHGIATFKGTPSFPATVTDYCCSTITLSPHIAGCRTRGTPPFTDHNIVILTLKHIPTCPTAKHAKRPRAPPSSPADEIHATLIITQRHKPKPPALTITWPPEHLQLLDLQGDLKRCNRFFTFPKEFKAQPTIAPLITASAKACKLEAYNTFCTELQKLWESNDHATFHAAIKNYRGSLHPRTHTTPHQKDRITTHYKNLLCTPQGPISPIASLFRLLPPRPLPAYQFDHSLPHLHIFTDGSFDDTRGGVRLGAAFYVATQPPEHHLIPLSQHTHRPNTINFAEAYAVLEALHTHPHANITVHSDSKVTVSTFRKRHTLTQSNFADTPHPHIWKQITHLAAHRQVDLIHLNSHRGNEGNEFADRLAKSAARLNLPPTRLTLTTPFPSEWLDIDQQTCIDRIIRDTTRATAQPIAPPLPLTFTIANRAAADRPPSEDEIKLALSMLSNTAPGDDDIPNYTLKNPDNLAALTQLYTTIWQTRRLCTDWHHSILIPIRKATGPITPENTRGISLLQTTMKLLERILLNRHPAPAIMGFQLGFQRARSCPQAIHAVRRLIDACVAVRRPLCIIFIDISKAFDSIPRPLIFDAMRLHGHSETDIALTSLMYQDTVRIRFPDGSLSTDLHPTVGTKQGSIRSPCFYNMVLDLPLRNADLPGFRLESDTGPFLFTQIAFADDIAAACDPENIATTLNRLSTELTKIQQHINKDKTKILLVMPDANQENRDTADGYDGRLEKLGITRRLHPDAAPSSILNGILRCPRGNIDISCCFADCKFTARKNLISSPQDLLLNHVRNTHHLPNIKRFLTFGMPPHGQHTDPRYVRARDPPPSIEGIEVVTQFKYLGSIVDHTGCHTGEIDRRIAVSNKAFFSIPREIWLSDKLHIKAKRQLYRSRVEPCLTYGTETWNHTQADLRRLNGAYMRHLRIICRKLPLRCTVNGELQWDTPAQHEVLAQIGMPPLYAIVRQHRMRLFGQGIRQDDNIALTWARGFSSGLARRGPPRQQWADLVAQDLKDLQLHENDAADVEKWKQLTKARAGIPQ